MLLLLERDGPQPIECLARKLAATPRHVRDIVASLERIGYARRSLGVVEMLAAATAESVFHRHVFPIAQINSASAEPEFRPRGTRVPPGGERGGSSLRRSRVETARDKTYSARASQEKSAAEPEFRGDPHEEQLDDRAASLARWLMAQLADLAWSPAYRIGLAVAEGQWSTGELRRVLRATLAARGRAELRSEVGYFVSACRSEIERAGYRWRRPADVG